MTSGIGMPRGRVSALDGLRGLAAVLVVSFHAGVPGIGRGGYFGLDIFFVLSGFLITGVLVGERLATARVRLGRFWLRRALRLYPALLVLCLALMPLGAVLAAGRGYGYWLQQVALAVTYTTDLPLPWASYPPDGPLAHTWTLAVEEQFYLLGAPLLVLLLRRRATYGRLAIQVLVVALALYALTLVVHSGADATSIYYRPELRFSELLLGVALSLALTGLPRPAPARLVRTARVLGALAMLGIVGISVVVPGPLEIRQTTFALLMACAALGTAAIILDAATGARGLASRLLSVRPMVALGVLSYGIYLWHLPLILLAVGHLQRPIVRVPLALAATLLLAYLSWRLVEQPFLRLKNRLRTTGVAGLQDAPGAARPTPAGSADSWPASPLPSPPT